MAGKFRVDVSKYLSEDYSPQGKSALTVWLMLALGKSKVGWEKRQKVIQRVIDNDCPQVGLPKWFDRLFKDLENEYNLLRGEAKQFYLDKTLEERFPDCLDAFNAPSSSHPQKRKNPSSPVTPRSHIHSNDETVLNPYPAPTLSLPEGPKRKTPCRRAEAEVPVTVKEVTAQLRRVKKTKEDMKEKHSRDITDLRMKVLAAEVRTIIINYSYPSCIINLLHASFLKITISIKPRMYTLTFTLLTTQKIAEEWKSAAYQRQEALDKCKDVNERMRLDYNSLQRYL